MRLHERFCQALAAWAVVLLTLSGCGDGDGPSTSSTKSEQPGESSIKRRTADSLKPIGEYLPPLDDAKIQVAPPAEWKLMPRDARYLARFVKGKASELPRITITAWDTPLLEVSDLDESNAALLAAHLVKEMKRDKKTVVELPKPIILGDTVFVRHVRRAKLPSGDNVVVQGLDTIRAGRIYTIELIANIDAPRAEQYEASLTKWRDYAYAVAANLKFGSDSAPPATESPPAPSTETPPPAEKATEKPAEENPKP